MFGAAQTIVTRGNSMATRFLYIGTCPSTDDDHDEESIIADLDAIKPLLATFEAVCRSLELRGPHDPLAEIVALKVIQIAKSGERDPERIRDLVLLSLHNA